MKKYTVAELLNLVAAGALELDDEVEILESESEADSWTDPVSGWEVYLDDEGDLAVSTEESHYFISHKSIPSLIKWLQSIS